MENTKNPNNIGAGWIDAFDDGKQFISAKITLNGEEIKLRIYKNDKKQAGTKQPDYQIYLAKPKAQQDPLSVEGPVHDELVRQRDRVDEEDIVIPF